MSQAEHEHSRVYSRDFANQLPHRVGIHFVFRTVGNQEEPI